MYEISNYVYLKKVTIYVALNEI